MNVGFCLFLFPFPFRFPYGSLIFPVHSSASGGFFFCSICMSIILQSKFLPDISLRYDLLDFLFTKSREFRGGT